MAFGCAVRPVGGAGSMWTACSVADCPLPLTLRGNTANTSSIDVAIRVLKSKSQLDNIFSCDSGAKY